MGQKNQEIKDSSQKLSIVDNDVHTAYRTEEIRSKIADRLEEPYKTYLTSENLNYGAYPRDSFPKAGLLTSGGRTEDTVAGSPEGIESELIDDFGIDIAILNSLQKFDLIPNRERAVREMRAVNDVFLEHYLDSHESFYGLAMLQTQKPEASAEEIDRLADEDHVVGGLVLNGASDKPLGDPIYDPIWRAAEENGLPIAFHSSANGYTQNRRFPFMYNDLQTYSALHMLSHPFANIVTATTLITNGVVEKFPDLDFVFLEMDLSIVPLLYGRLNRETKQEPFEHPLLDKSPEEYMRESFYWGTQPIPEPLNKQHVRDLISMIGADNILFATDYPHQDFDQPSAVIDSYFSHLSNEEIDKIMYKNASEVYGLGL